MRNKTKISVYVNGELQRQSKTGVFVKIDTGDMFDGIDIELNIERMMYRVNKFSDTSKIDFVSFVYKYHKTLDMEL